LAAEPGREPLERPRVVKRPRRPDPMFSVEVVSPPEATPALDRDRLARMLADLLRKHDGSVPGEG